MPAALIIRAFCSRQSAGGSIAFVNCNGTNRYACTASDQCTTKHHLAHAPLGLCRASMKMFPFLLDKNVHLRSETPTPSCDDCAACSGSRQDYPAAHATAARGLDGTGRKQEPHIPHKREWELLESATGTFLLRRNRGHFYRGLTCTTWPIA